MLSEGHIKIGKQRLTIIVEQPFDNFYNKVFLYLKNRIVEKKVVLNTIFGVYGSNTIVKGVFKIVSVHELFLCNYFQIL
jgi:hypothetical protein